MDELTNSSNRRRNRKSKDFSGSPLAGMFNKENKNDSLEDKEQSVTRSDDSIKKNTPDSNDDVLNKDAPTPSNDRVSPQLSSLPKKQVKVKPVGIDHNDDNFEIMRGGDGKYKLSQNTIYKKVKNIPRTLSIREDVMLIVDELSKNGSNGYTRGVKSTIVSNGIMRELYEIGMISKSDLKRELRPYE